jgi:hypothetical protein
MHALGDESISSSLFVTDSLDDLPLLAKCARPLRTIWPEAQFRRALGRIYLPGEYITQVKRPGERYISRVILQEDLAFWILSSVALAAHPLFHMIGLGLLLASFWTIYERGYVDNDWAAAHLERDGKLSVNFWQSPVATPAVQPWIWAAAAGAAGVYLVRWPNVTLLDFGKWLAVLASTYGTFKLYNRIDKSSRTWLFAALQLARSAAFVVLVPVPALGAVALGALALARWVPYYVYRLGDKGWPDLRANLTRLLFFIVLAALLATSQGVGILLNWTAAAILAWNTWRARVELLPVLAGIRRLDKTPPRG